MSYLVDTNIYSEPVKPNPDAKVVAWLRKHEGERYLLEVLLVKVRQLIEGNEVDAVVEVYVAGVGNDQ